MVFKPGQSGNPSGRPKVPEDVKEMLRALVPDAVQALGRALRSDDEAIAIKAADTVLNRVYGRPHTTADINVKNIDGPAAQLEALRTLAALANAIPQQPVPMVDVTPHREPLPLTTFDTRKPT